MYVASCVSYALKGHHKLSPEIGNCNHFQHKNMHTKLKIHTKQQQ